MARKKSIAQALFLTDGSPPTVPSADGGVRRGGRCPRAEAPELGGVHLPARGAAAPPREGGTGRASKTLGEHAAAPRRPEQDLGPVGAAVEEHEQVARERVGGERAPHQHESPSNPCASRRAPRDEHLADRSGQRYSTEPSTRTSGVASTRRSRPARAPPPPRRPPPAQALAHRRARSGRPAPGAPSRRRRRACTTRPLALQQNRARGQTRHALAARTERRDHAPPVLVAPRSPPSQRRQINPSCHRDLLASQKGPPWRLARRGYEVGVHRGLT